MGAQDPRLNSAYEINFRLQQTLHAWKHTDPGPLCVKPIPITVIHRIVVLATSDVVDDTFQAASDMIIIAFFFLLCTGEYTDNNKDPFHLTDTQLFIGDTRILLLTAPASELCLAWFASLTFTSQKNGVRGKVIGLACSGNPYLCPVQAIICRVLYLHLHMAPPTTPLTQVFHTPNKVAASYLTSCICESVMLLGLDLGFLPSEVLAWCLRATGAKALLLAQVIPDVIRLIGRWRLDKMLWYLHIQSYPLMRDYSHCMLSASAYTLISNHLVPQQ
jgi:hypothetical protein